MGKLEKSANFDNYEIFDIFSKTAAEPMSREHEINCHK